MARRLWLLILVAALAASARVASAQPSYAWTQGRSTYVASVSGQATTAATLVSLEASSNQRVWISKVCVATSPATAAAAVTVTLQRRTTASSGGTALTNEGTGTTAVSKLDPNDSNFAGIARLNGTPGTGGAVIDQWGFVAPVITAGGAAPFCLNYYDDGAGVPIKIPTIAAGVANGISVNVSAAGAGGLADGAVSIYFFTD